jgi:carbamoyltransferase
VFILGLNCFNADSAACLVRDGRIVAAAEEERFRRIRHWAGFPSHAIRYCLKEASLTAWTQCLRTAAQPAPTSLPQTAAAE